MKYDVIEAYVPEHLRLRVSFRDGFVEWPGEIDLAPDAMYEEIKRSGIWELA